MANAERERERNASGVVIRDERFLDERIVRREFASRYRAASRCDALARTHARPLHAIRLRGRSQPPPTLTSPTTGRAERATPPSARCPRRTTPSTYSCRLPSTAVTGSRLRSHRHAPHRHARPHLPSHRVSDYKCVHARARAQHVYAGGIDRKRRRNKFRRD